MQKILIADDDDIFRRLIIQYLNKKGYETIEEISGKRVLNQVLEHSPCACIIDIIMSEKEGLETITELSRLPEKPLLIAVSSDEQYLEWAKDFGADFLQLKPITVQKIDEIISFISQNIK